MKKMLKAIGYVFLGLAILFIVAIVSGIIFLHIVSQPKVYIDSNPDISQESWNILTWIQSEVEGVFYTADFSFDDVDDLYVSAGHGFLFKNLFIAFRIEDQQIRQSLFTNDYFSYDDFQNGSFSSKGPWEDYLLPHEWGKRYQDSNWPLKQSDAFMYYGDYQKLVLFTPEDNRIYICIDNGP